MSLQLQRFGRRRATASPEDGNLDVWLLIDRGNAEKLIHALTEFGFGSLGLSVDSQFASRESTVKSSVIRYS